MNDTIDIVTLTHNSSHCFRRFLQGLLNGGHPDIKLIVVDNQSDKDERDSMRFTLGTSQMDWEWIDSGYNTPWHHCQHSPDPEVDAYGYSINIGLRAGTNPYVLAINPDCFGDYELDWLHIAIASYKAWEPDIGIMGAILLHSWGKVNHAGGKAQGIHIGRNGKDSKDYDAMRRVKWVTGAWHFMSRAVLEKVGYYKNSKEWASDGQLCINAENLGHPCYCAPVRLYHNEMESSDKKRYEKNEKRKT